jgi:hypothetical protein
MTCAPIHYPRLAKDPGTFPWDNSKKRAKRPAPHPVRPTALPRPDLAGEARHQFELGALRFWRDRVGDRH